MTKEKPPPICADEYDYKFKVRVVKNGICFFGPTCYVHLTVGRISQLCESTRHTTYFWDKLTGNTLEARLLRCKEKLIVEYEEWLETKNGTNKVANKLTNLLNEDGDKNDC